MPYEYFRARLIQQTGWTLDYIDSLDIWEQRRLMEMLKLINAPKE